MYAWMEFLETAARSAIVPAFVPSFLDTHALSFRSLIPSYVYEDVYRFGAMPCIFPRFLSKHQRCKQESDDFVCVANDS